MIRRLHFYDAETGIFSGRSFAFSADPSIDEKAIEDLISANTPDGHRAHEAPSVDPLSQRRDLRTGRLTDYQPPAPSPAYEWNTTAKRWVLTQGAQRKLMAATNARMQVDALTQQSRVLVRKALLSIMTPSQLATDIGKQLAALDAQIDALTQELMG